MTRTHQVFHQFLQLDHIASKSGTSEAFRFLCFLYFTFHFYMYKGLIVVLNDIIYFCELKLFVLIKNVIFAYSSRRCFALKQREVGTGI